MIDLSFLAEPMPLRLWRVALDREPDALELAWLSDDERARAARFAFARDRRRYLAAHCALRRILAACTARPAGELRFEAGPHGKPALAPPAPACSFNLSHSEEVALIAVAPHDEPVGVDVEMLRELPDAERLAERHYTLRERRELREAAPGRARQLAFLRGWTRKEACLKALGSGLAIEPHGFETGLSPEPRVVGITGVDGRRVAVQVQSFCHDGGLVGAVARIARPPAAPALPAHGCRRAA